MHLSKEKIEYFKKRLEEEKVKLEKGLGYLGTKNPVVPDDWEAKLNDLEIETADKNVLADVYEEREQRVAIQDKLEEGLKFVNEALAKIKSGVYGICENCGEEIDEKRLKAYPSAKNCVKHSQRNH